MRTSNTCLIGGGAKEPILRKALNTLHTEHADVLIVPTPCSTQKSYDSKVPANIQLFRDLGVNPTVLHEFGETPTQTAREHEFGRAAMIFVTGGNTPHMMRMLQEHGTNKDFHYAAQRGVMLAGVSAGAILPFHRGHSVITTPSQPTVYELVEGLGIIPATVAVHANITPKDMSEPRLSDFLKQLTADGMPALAIENNAALLSIDDTH